MIQNLRKFLKDIADAIREKTGKSELIKPVDFAEEIRGITAGGGESGGSSYIYYDQKRALMNIKFIWEYSATIKVSFSGQTVILRTCDNVKQIKENGLEEYIIAVCIDPNIKFQTEPNTPPLTWIEQDPGSFEMVNEVRITEEEYFNLNA